MSTKVTGRPAVHPNQLKRQNPARGDRLDTLQRRLKLASHTEVLAEAIAIALLITDRGRRAFFIEENGPGTPLVKIDL